MPIDAAALERLRKLRSLGVRRGARDLARPAAPPPEPLSGGLPGEVRVTPHGPAWACVTRYPLAEQPEMAALLAAPATALAALGRDPGLLALDPAHAAFIDTETTGLSLGVSTYTFLIGVGKYELGPDGLPEAFVVHQFFMRHPGEERAQLYLLEAALADCTGIISFNGRGFDMPLLANRFTLAYLPPPLPGAPHLDLLPPARRIWRARYGSCSLGDLERNVLALQRSAADVPGWMIPGIYRDFYQNPSAANLELIGRVFYHNLQDIASMALLAAIMANFFVEPDPVARLDSLHPLEYVSLARCYEALAWVEAAEMAYRTALAGQLADGERSETLRGLSLWLKRLGRREEAAELWETWITSTAGTDLTPYVELAKHHEWHTGDLVAARGWTAWALRIVQETAPAFGAGAERAELERRLARLEGKLARRAVAEGGDAEE